MHKAQSTAETNQMALAFQLWGLTSLQVPNQIPGTASQHRTPSSWENAEDEYSHARRGPLLSKNASLTNQDTSCGGMRHLVSYWSLLFLTPVQPWRGTFLQAARQSFSVPRWKLWSGQTLKYFCDITLLREIEWEEEMYTLDWSTNRYGLRVQNCNNTQHISTISDMFSNCSSNRI